MVTKTGFVIFPLCSLLLGKTTLSDQNYCIWRKHVWRGSVTLAEYLWNGCAIDLFSLPCLTKWVPMLDTNAARPVPLVSCSGYRLTRLHRYSPYNWKCGSDGGSAISVMIRLIRTSCSWLITSMHGRTNKPVMWQERRHKMWPELYHCSWNSTIVWLYINQIYKYTTTGVVLTRLRVLMDEQTVHIEYAAQAPMISQATIVPSCRQYPHSEDATCSASNYQQGLTAVRHRLRVALNRCRYGNNAARVFKMCTRHAVRLLDDCWSVLHVEVRIRARVT